MFAKSSPLCAVGNEPSKCTASPVNERVALWCGLRDPKLIEQIVSSKLDGDTLVLGTNATYSVALRGNYKEYKKIKAQQEIMILNDYLAIELHNVETKAAAKRVRKLLNTLNTRDLVLADVCKLAEIYLKSQMEHFSDEKESPFKKDLKRDALPEATIGRLKKELSTVEKSMPYKETSKFSISLCPTPENEGQKWRNDVYTFRARKGTFPIGAINDTHIVLLYCDPDASFDEFDMTAEFIRLPQNSKRIKTEWKMTFRIPPLEVTTGVTLHVSLDKKSPTCIIGLANFVFLLDPRKDKRLWYKFTEARVVSCVSVDDQVKLAGTTQGEIYRFDDESVYVYHTPKMEAILQATWLPKQQVMCSMTCMGVFIETTNGRMQIDSLRPVSFHTDGEILTVYSKYGFVQVQPLLITDMANVFDPIETDDACDLPAYDAIYNSDRRMIIVETNGRVRVWTAK